MAIHSVAFFCFLVSFALRLHLPQAQPVVRLSQDEGVSKTELNDASYQILGGIYAGVLLNLKGGIITDVLQQGCAPVAVFLSRLAWACGINDEPVLDVYCEFLGALNVTVADESLFCGVSGRRKRSSERYHPWTCR